MAEEEEEEFLARLGTGYANLFKQAYRRRYNISVGITRVRYMSVLGNRSKLFVEHKTVFGVIACDPHLGAYWQVGRCLDAGEKS